MNYLKNISLALLCTLCLSFAWFHHGWSEYNQKKVLNFKTKVVESVYENPHALIKVKYKGKLHLVYLAPTSRMTDRGLKAEMIEKGTPIRLVAYPHKTKKDEMRAERIFVADIKYELR